MVGPIYSIVGLLILRAPPTSSTAPSIHSQAVNVPPTSSTAPSIQKKRKKISISDLSGPSNFQHLAHVGWDPNTGAFDSNNIDAAWKKLFDMVGVSDTDLKDEQTAKFIYDFVEKHGGIEKANQQLEAEKQKAPPPPPSYGGSHRSGQAAPPPPPPHTHGSRGARPPPNRNVPPPPPSHSTPPLPPPPPSKHDGGGNVSLPPGQAVLPPRVDQTDSIDTQANKTEDIQVNQTLHKGATAINEPANKKLSNLIREALTNRIPQKFDDTNGDSDEDEWSD